MADEDPDRHSRLHVPFTSPPELSFADAVLATVIAFVRIVVGSLLFAIWGTCTLLAAAQIASLVARIAAIVLAFVLFVLLVAALIRVTSALAGLMSTRHP